MQSSLKMLRSKKLKWQSNLEGDSLYLSPSNEEIEVIIRRKNVYLTAKYLYLFNK